MPYEKQKIGDHVLYRGDSLEVLADLAPGSVAGFLTDPPYSSGGQFRGDRNQKTSTKYVNTDSVEGCRIEFSGDNKDQRSFLAWSCLAFGMMHRAAKDGATLCTFTDWRQLPTMTDAIQGGGWIWRNLITWWKPGCRMQRGRFSASAEYVLYGSKGVPTPGEFSPQNVLRHAPVPGKTKSHIAEKPAALLVDLLGVSMPGDVIVDPFMGSGSTGVACSSTGRKFIGIEMDERAFEQACRNVHRASRRVPLFL
jgi:site-specific DNA-methyltransferase (adenine-specific)